MKLIKWILLAIGMGLLLAYAATAQTVVDDGHALVVSSFPDGAQVTLDGVVICQATPCEVHKIAVGQHQIQVGTNLQGWQTDTRTITVLDVDPINGRVRDTHLSFTLMPTLTQGPPGPQGLNGKSPTLHLGSISVGVPAAGIDNTDPLNPVLSLTLPPGIQGLPGIGINGQNGTNGANGKDGASGINGTNGTNGLPGRSPYQGVWSSSLAYQVGDEVTTTNPLPDGATEKPGPYFYLATGDNGQDPGNNPAWVYCCGNAGWAAAVVAPPPPPPGQWSNSVSGALQPGTFWCWPLVPNQGTLTPNPCQGNGDYGAAGSVSTDSTQQELAGHTVSNFSVMLSQDLASGTLTFIFVSDFTGAAPQCVIQQGGHSCSVSFGPFTADASVVGLGVRVIWNAPTPWNGQVPVWNPTWVLQ